MSNAKSRKSSKTLRMLMVCGAAVAMLSPIVASPLNSIMPSNTITANASRRRVRKSHKRLSKKQLKRNARAFRKYAFRRFINNARKMAKRTKKTKLARRFNNASHRWNKALAAEHAYMKHLQRDSNAMDSSSAQNHLAKLARQAKNAELETDMVNWTEDTKVSQSGKRELARYKHSKNPYIRSFVKKQINKFNSRIRANKRNSSKARRQI